MMRRFVALFLLISGIAHAQQPQTQTAPIYAANARYVQGAGPGYWPTPGSGLTLNLAAGRVRCSNTMTNYAGGTLTMANNTTNYVYLDTASSCAPASNTSGYTSTAIAIATVVTSSGVITTITDDRVFGIATPAGGVSGTVTTTGSPSSGNLTKFSGASSITNGDLTGDVTTSATLATTLANIPSGTPMAGSLLATNVAAPSAPAAGKNSLFSDSTDLRFHDKNASNVIGTTVVADAGASNNFLTAISAAGAISKARPACANLSDSAPSCSTDATAAGNISSGTLPAGRLPALTGDVTSSAGSAATTIAANAITASKSAVVLTRRVCAMIVGADNAGSVLANADLGPQGRQCFVPFAATVVEIDVDGDAGTPNVIPGVNHAGSISNLVSSALATASAGGIACSKTGATTCIDGATTASATLQNTSIAAGDYLELVSGTAGGTAKRMSVFVIYTVN